MVHVYSSEPELIKSSKSKDSILYNGYYYNHLRTNKTSVVYKCRELIDGCGSLTMFNDMTFTTKPHNKKHLPMIPIECDVKKARFEIEKLSYH